MSSHNPSMALLAATLALTGCPPVDNPYRLFPEPDYAQFEVEIQPLVRENCAYLGCHGDHQRSLTLYAVDYLRAVPSVEGQAVEEDALTDSELFWNYDALRIRLADETSAEDSRLLLKCLDPALGGIDHADGEVIFEDLDDPGYQSLKDWIAGAL